MPYNNKYYNSQNTINILHSKKVIDKVKDMALVMDYVIKVSQSKT